eukprot:GDKH01013473.1.p1 GENE.GDKH01013473.1~~GDKH01013473.1.p1  ORF type:complete len:289 (-),score=19.08 GDKH01013473.1:83-949(-)
MRAAVRFTKSLRASLSSLALVYDTELQLSGWQIKSPFSADAFRHMADCDDHQVSGSCAIMAPLKLRRLLDPMCSHEAGTIFTEDVMRLIDGRLSEADKSKDGKYVGVPPDVPAKALLGDVTFYGLDRDAPHILFKGVIELIEGRGAIAAFVPGNLFSPEHDDPVHAFNIAEYEKAFLSRDKEWHSMAVVGTARRDEDTEPSHFVVLHSWGPRHQKRMIAAYLPFFTRDMIAGTTVSTKQTETLGIYFLVPEAVLPRDVPAIPTEMVVAQPLPVKGSLSPLPLVYTKGG